jgi:precorrin-6B methylase 2
VLSDFVERVVEFQGRRYEMVAPVKVIAKINRDGWIESGLCRLILEHCQPGQIVLDVGANYGFVTLVMAQAVGISGQVHAFEANGRIFRALATTIEKNGLAERCQAVHGFVGDVVDGDRRVTIDSYVKLVGLPRVDFLKIDVDGPDFEVLDGARETLSRFHPMVAIETTREQHRIISLLREQGYECTDMKGAEIDPSAWPPNVLAAVGRRLQVPPRSEPLRR